MENDGDGAVNDNVAGQEGMETKTTSSSSTVELTDEMRVLMNSLDMSVEDAKEALEQFGSITEVFRYHFKEEKKLDAEEDGAGKEGGGVEEERLRREEEEMRLLKIEVERVAEERKAIRDMFDRLQEREAKLLRDEKKILARTPARTPTRAVDEEELHERLAKLEREIKMERHGSVLELRDREVESPPPMDPPRTFTYHNRSDDRSARASLDVDVPPATRRDALDLVDGPDRLGVGTGASAPAAAAAAAAAGASPAVTATTDTPAAASRHRPALFITKLLPDVKFGAWAQAAMMRLTASDAPEDLKLSMVFEAMLTHERLLEHFSNLRSLHPTKTTLELLQLMRGDAEIADYVKPTRRKPFWPTYREGKDTIRAHAACMLAEAEDVGVSDTELKVAFQTSLVGRAKAIATEKADNFPKITAKELIDYVCHTLENNETQADYQNLQHLAPEGSEEAGNKEKVVPYSTRLIEEATRILTKRGYTMQQVEEMALMIFIKNVGGVIGEKLQDLHPQSWDHAITVARNIEARLEREKQETGRLGAFHGRGGGRGGRGGRGGGRGGRNGNNNNHSNNNNNNGGQGGQKNQGSSSSSSGNQRVGAQGKGKGLDWVLQAQCHHCNEVGHIKIGCPKFLAELKKGKESKNSKRGPAGTQEDSD